MGEPGAQGAAVTGTHGIGVNTPLAAAVAAATVGFANEVHIMKGGMLVVGTLSMMFAANLLSHITVGSMTTNVDGPVPKLHCIIAPRTTGWPILHPDLKTRDNFLTTILSFGEPLGDPRVFSRDRCTVANHVSDVAQPSWEQGANASKSMPSAWSIFISDANIIMAAAPPDIEGAEAASDAAA